MRKANHNSPVTILTKKHSADVEAKLTKLDTERTKRNYVEHDGEIEIGLPDLLQSLDKCFKVLNEIKNKPMSLEKELHQIKKDLIRLTETPSKELTLQDVVPYHNRLRNLEMSKVDGKFHLVLFCLTVS